jgi:putative transposase
MDFNVFAIYYISVKRTVSIPIQLDSSRFLSLMERSAKIFNVHVDWALENKTYSKSKAHHALYQQIKEQHPQMPTALIQAVRDTAMEAVKATKFKKKPRKKKYSGLRYDKRTMTLRGHQLSLSCIGERERIILEMPEYFRNIFETWTLKGATLTYSVKTKQFWIRLIYETESPHIKIEGTILGIDRGLCHLAVTSEGDFFSNNNIRASQRRYLYNRKTLQTKGTPSSRRRLRSTGGKEKRFSRDVNHRITKQLSHLDHVKLYVLEDLKGIRNKNRGKRGNKRIASWPFHQFNFFLKYKAEMLGKQVVYVDPRYTSQKCSCCKATHKKSRKKGKYHCMDCHFQLHADWNAAINIRDNYILSSTPKASEEQATVNWPNVTVGNNQSQAYYLVQ